MTRTTKNNTGKTPEDFECEGAARERSKNPKRRQKGSFKKLNSKNRLHGSGYIKFNSYNLVQPKTIGARCCGNCRIIGKKCHTFSDADRTEIFKGFYGLRDLQLQREFICRHVESDDPKDKRAGDDSQRQATNTYFLTIRRKRTKVCLTFFLRTLAISEQVVRTSL